MNPASDVEERSMGRFPRTSFELWHDRKAQNLLHGMNKIEVTNLICICKVAGSNSDRILTVLTAMGFPKFPEPTGSLPCSQAGPYPKPHMSSLCTATLFVQNYFSNTLLSTSKSLSFPIKTLFAFISLLYYVCHMPHISPPPHIIPY